METIKQVMIDSFNGLSVDLIPLFLFQLLMAGLLGYLAEKILNRKFQQEVVSHSSLIAISVSVLASIVKYSLPGSVLAAAVILIFLKSKENTLVQVIGTFMVLVIGVGCGLGSVIQTLIGFVLLGLVILFLPLKR